MWINGSDNLRLISGGRAACKNNYISSYQIIISCCGFHSILSIGSKDTNVGMEDLSPSQCRLQYLASKHYGISNSCDNPGHKSHRIHQKYFFVWMSSQSENKISIPNWLIFENASVTFLWHCGWYDWQGHPIKIILLLLFLASTITES